MSRLISRKMTRKQIEKMTDFMEKYPQLFHGTVSRGGFEKSYKDQLWRELTDILNAEDGPNRNVKRWMKSFKDYKCYVRKKYLSYLADTSTLCSLSHFEVRILAMMGYVVDIERVHCSSNGDLQAYILQEINTDVVEDVNQPPECKEQNQRFYHAPEIIIVQQQGANSTPTVTQDCSEVTPNKESSKTADEVAPCNKETPRNEESLLNEEMQDIDELSLLNEKMQDIDELSLLNEESSCNEELQFSKKSSSKKYLSEKSKLKKISSILKKKRGGNSKNATAAALQAIAKELSKKNELTKMKIKLGKEQLILEKRKVEAFELIAKRLHRK